ncbi:MAG: FAD-binding oxidoreductase [Anaerolineae bacterium]|nr:FAD-binding oxidoreductase [Anaerolineae bacterium]
MTQRFFSNPGITDIPRTADVIVIGGGPAGAAAVWALERAAPGIRTVLIEQSSQLAAGSSTASLENYRTCWPAPCLARLMVRSIEVFHHADEYLGEGAANVLGLKEQGYLYCGFTAQQAAALRQEVQHLHEIGLTHVEYLDAAAIQARYPWLEGRVIAAKFDPVAGWLDSHALIYRFVQQSPHAKILLDVPDVRITVEHNCITGVTIPAGHIAAPHVIIAAGANARQVGRTAGIELPLVVRPRQSFTTPWRHPLFPADSPALISAAPFPHVRPEAQSGAIFGWEYHWNNKRIKPEGVPTSDALIDPVWPVTLGKDPRFPSMVLALLARHFGYKAGDGFAHPRYLSGIDHRAGYYVYRAHAYTTAADGATVPYESQRAIIDSWSGIDGLHLSVAHVGHGVMSSPAGGEIVAAKVLGKPLPDPLFEQFGLNVPWVAHDSGGLSAQAADPA